MDTGFQLLSHFFDTPQSWGEQVLDKKGDNVLDRDVNHELTRRTQFSDSVGQEKGMTENEMVG